jgi:hypothetical protein
VLDFLYLSILYALSRKFVISRSAVQLRSSAPFLSIAYSYFRVLPKNDCGSFVGIDFSPPLSKGAATWSDSGDCPPLRPRWYRGAEKLRLRTIAELRIFAYQTSYNESEDPASAIAAGCLPARIGNRYRFARVPSFGSIRTGWIATFCTAAVTIHSPPSDRCDFTSQSFPT